MCVIPVQPTSEAFENLFHYHPHPQRPSMTYDTTRVILRDPRKHKYDRWEQK